MTFSDKIEDVAGFPLDTISFSPDFMGREAVKMLLTKIKNADSDIPSIKCPFRYEKGESCAAPAF
jgi:DNA-binding LacI/PurR family transcriptional regulator